MWGSEEECSQSPLISLTGNLLLSSTRSRLALERYELRLMKEAGKYPPQLLACLSGKDQALKRTISSR